MIWRYSYLTVFLLFSAFLLIYLHLLFCQTSYNHNWIHLQLIENALTMFLTELESNQYLSLWYSMFRYSLFFHGLQNFPSLNLYICSGKLICYCYLSTLVCKEDFIHISMPFFNSYSSFEFKYFHFASTIAKNSVFWFFGLYQVSIAHNLLMKKIIWLFWLLKFSLFLWYCRSLSLFSVILYIMIYLDSHDLFWVVLHLFS